jgi:bifunctional pyridoxal-dependent enzyme with beta-cystathionase and maltose regulon repressor activities
MITIDDGDKEEMEHSIFGYPVQRTGTFASILKWMEQYMF